MILNKRLIVFLAVVLLIGLAGYYFISIKSEEKEKIPETEEPESPQITNIISIGTIGSDPVTQTRVFQPTADYVASKLGNNATAYKGKVIIVKTIDEISDLLKEQKLDLFVDSPFTTVIVSKKSGAVPFLRRWKEGVGQYHTVFIVKKNSSINTLTDFTGKTIAAEDPASTSAYFLPKAYLLQKGFNVNQSAGKNYIRFVFSGKAENTPLWVVEGKADIGAISNMDFIEIPGYIKDKLKIIERTEDVPRHVVSYRSGLEPVMVENIKQIFLDMDKDPQGIEIMKNFQGTKKYDEISKDEVFNASRMVELLNNNNK